MAESRIPLEWRTFDGTVQPGPVPGANPFIEVEVAGYAPRPTVFVRTMALVDTGCTISFVRRDILARIGAPRAGEIEMHGNGGASRVRLHRVSLRPSNAPWFLLDCDVGELELPPGHYSGAGVGMDLLRLGVLTLSASQGTFELRSEPHG